MTTKPYQYRAPAQLYGDAPVARPKAVTAKRDAPLDAVTPSRDVQQPLGKIVTKSRDADTSAKPGVTVSRDAWEAVLERLDKVEAWIAEKDRPGATAAERAKRYRARKKAEKAQNGTQ